MVSAVYGSGGVYGFLGLSTQSLGSQNFTIFSQNGVGYNYNLTGGYSLGSLANTGTGFGPFVAGTWTSGAYAEVAANGSVYSSISPTSIPLPSGYSKSLVGVSLFSASGVFVFDSLGSVSSVSTAGVISSVTGADIPINISLHQSYPSYSGTTVFYPATSGGVASYSFMSLSAGSAALVPPPIGATFITCCCVTGNSLYVGSSTNSVFAQNAVNACQSTGSPALLATISPTQNYIQVWSGSINLIGPSFNSVGQLSVSGLTSSLASVFTGNNQFCVFDLGSGIFYNYKYVGGTISLNNSISGVTGTYNSIGYNGVSAFVPQRSTSGLYAFTQNTTGFTVLGSGFISNVTGVNIGPVVVSPSGILAVSYATGAAFYTPTVSGTFVLGSNFSTSGQIVAWSIDQFGNFFGCSSGYSYLFGASASNAPPSGFIKLQTNVTGIPVGCTSYNLQYFTAFNSGVAIQDLYSTGGVENIYSVQPTGNWVLNTGSAFVYSSGSMSLNGALWFNGTFLAPSSKGILELSLSSPFTLGQTSAGLVGVYNLATSSYGSNISGLAYNVIPCSVGIDASGIPVFSNLDGSIFQYTSTVSAYQSVYSGGGGLVGLVPYSSGFYGAAALAPAVIGFTA